MPAAQKSPSKLFVAMFVIYLVLLVWVILWKLEKSWVGEAALLPRPLKLVPFVASGDAGPSNPKEVAANILFFIPFGPYLGSLARWWRWWQLTAVFLGASLLLETSQHLLSTRSFDTSDLISNTAGGLAVIGTAVSLVAIAALIVSPLRYGPQHDVIVPRNATWTAVLGGPRLGV
jgi:glycopeptide antibiotics resistance protein